MLRKRTRSLEKDQQIGQLTMFDSVTESHPQSGPLDQRKASSFFRVPGLFVGLSPKRLSDSDSARSPTSPLDFRMFSKSGNRSRSPRSGFQKTWDCKKVGLSIVDSLDDGMNSSRKVLRSSETKKINFGPQVSVKTSKFLPQINSFEAPKSLPRNFAIFLHTFTKSPLQKGNSEVLFEIGGAPPEPDQFANIRSCSLDSCRPFSTPTQLAGKSSKMSYGSMYMDKITGQVNSAFQVFEGSLNSSNIMCMNSNISPISVGSGDGLVGSLSASEIELSEDYTCVISHGPNPKKTYIYGDCILESHSNELSNFGKNEGKDIGLLQAVTDSSTIPNAFPSNDFLSFCYYCNKKLDEGKDIYMYRGEKAFCSLNCRSQEILVDEELEKPMDISSDASPKSENGEDVFEMGIFDAP